MDHFKEAESSASRPGFRKAKKSTMGPPTDQPRRYTSEDVVMQEPAAVSSAGGSMSRFSVGEPFNRTGGLNTERSSSGARQHGHTFPQMRKKTSMATKSFSPLLVASKSVNTPRVRFVQQKSATNRPPPPYKVHVTHAQNAIPTFSLPARKAASSSPFQKQQQEPSLQPTPFSVKTARPLLPLWQQLDEEHERVSKRKKGVRMISSAQSRAHVGQTIDQTRNKAHIAPKLHLRLHGEMDISSTDDEDHGPRQQPPKRIPIKIQGGRKIAVKKSAARKIEFVNTSSDEVSESGSTIDNDSEEDQLLPEEYEVPLNLRSDPEHDPLPPSTIFNPAPQITIALPQVKAEPEDGLPVGEHGPPDELVNAIEALTISAIRMQATQQLPFLRRNLRKGFISRCADVLIPIHSDQKHVSLEVTYEYVDGIVFQAKIEDWLCPLCNLFGKFTTQATLYCHIKWDHKEIFSDWKKIEESDVRQEWQLQVMIPQEVRDDGQVRHLHLQDGAEDEKEQDEEEEEEEEEDAEIPEENIPRSPSIPASNFASPFPSVPLSPFSPLQLSPTKQEVSSSGIPSTLKTELSIETTPAPPISRSISILQPSSSRSRSMTGTSQGTTTTATNTTTTPRIHRDVRYPTPPPPDDPLGPAARPPYLPAHSEYGGPTVYYSCRPGGACLFDLLGTLPMNEFGILDWEVLDREEEIYESDDVKEEYKVMHALWARWIMLHRNDFISNYYQGTLVFVNFYWRMIHRAAGWDALRFWLLILLANQFLNAHEVAQILTHYEELTGMASWGESF